jgi:hypothetical protein
VTNRPICGGQTVSLQALCFRGLWEVEMKEVFFRSFGTTNLQRKFGHKTEKEARRTAGAKAALTRAVKVVVHG